MDHDPSPQRLSEPDFRLAQAGQRWLASVQAFFPGVSLSHVLDLAKAAGITNEIIARSVDEHCEAVQSIVDSLLGHNGNYPKAQIPVSDGVGVENEIRTEPVATEAFSYMNPDRPALLPFEREIARRLLCNTFTNVSVAAIEKQLCEHRHLLPTYLNLLKLSANSGSSILSRIKKARRQYPITRSDIAQHLQTELESAKQLDAVSTTEVECGCCTGPVPLWRAAHCSGTMEHYFCNECIRNYVSSSLVGSGMCRPVCFDISGDCSVEISSEQLSRFIDPKIMLTLETMQQQDDLRRAFPNAELEQCPKCEFQMLMEAPPEVDREFRCLNHACQAVSCRLCKEKLHLPLTCDESARREKGLNTRKVVEEAMTEALLRRCNKCKNSFIKSEGCNKMTCTKCGNLQCYVCGANVENSYIHFADKYHGGTGTCALWDGKEGLEKKHDGEVKTAADAAIAALLADNPELTENDLQVKFSERVFENGGDSQAAAAAPAAAGVMQPAMIGQAR